MITRAFKQQIGDISEEEANLEGFKTRAEFFEAWRQINGSCDLEAMVTVYEFELVN